MSSRLHVIAHIRAKPDCVDQVRAVLVGYVDKTRAEDGCFVYDLLQNQTDPAHFTVVEEWSGEPALAAHAQSPHITEGRAKLGGLTAGPTEIVRYARLA